MSDVLEQRKSRLSRYGVITEFYDLETMSDSEFDALLVTSRLTFEGKTTTNMTDKDRVVGLLANVSNVEMPSCESKEGQAIVAKVRRDILRINKYLSIYIIYLNQKSL